MVNSKKFLEEKIVSVKNRIKEGTGIDIEPIYYSAGYKENNEKQCQPYNLSKLLSYIVKFTPKEKRLSFIENINRNEEMWKDNDDLKDYQMEIKKSFGETVSECATKGADIGGEIGAVFGRAGEIIGRSIGKAFGAAAGFIKVIFRRRR